MKRMLIFVVAAMCLFAVVSSHAQQWVKWETTDGGNGHWYKAVINTNALNWTQVEQIARNEGGYLATITSQEENAFVFSLINSSEFFQGIGGNGSGPAIGGYQPDGSPEPDGGWRWESGETWTFTSWAPGQPDNGGGVENRLHYWSGSQSIPAATWNDLSVTDNNLGGYIIEREDNSASKSGFYGQAFIGGSGDPLFPLLGIPTEASVSVYDSNNKLIKLIRSNPVGQFYSYVQPGNYTLVGTVGKLRSGRGGLTRNTKTNDVPASVSVSIIVGTNQLVQVQINF